MKYYTFFLLLTLLQLMACNTSPQPNGILDSSIPESTKPKEAQVYNLSNTDFKSKLASIGNPQLVDVRTDGEVAEGMLPHAVQMNISTSEFGDQVATLDKNRPVFLYCAGGERSKQAATSLSAWGFTTIYELNEGYSSWESEGFPTTKK